MIDRLVMQRFRGIKEGVLQDLSKINVLIGPNNSGKTAILEMLYLSGVNGRAAQLILEDMPSATKDEGIVFNATVPIKNDFLAYEPLQRLRKRHGHEAPWYENPAVPTREGGIAVNLESLAKNSPLKGFRLGAPQEEWGGKRSLKFDERDIADVVSFSLNKQKNIPKFLVPLSFETQNILSEESRWNYLWENIWVYQREQKEFIDHFACWAETGTTPDPEHVLLFDFHAANDHFSADFVNKVKNEIVGSWEKKIAEKLRRVFPIVEDAEVEIDDAPRKQVGKSGYILLPEMARLPVDMFGDGMRHSFKVLASLVALAEFVDDERPGLFLWEDPELFMHPATLGFLMKEVIRIIKEKPIQAFFSTQSLDVLTWIGQMLNEKSIDSKSMNAYSLVLKSNGELKNRLFQGEDIVSWLESGFDLRDAETAMIDQSPLSWRLKSSGEEEILW